MTNLPKEYRNRLVHGDVMDTLRALPDNCIDMVWSEPDYNVGIDYTGKSYKMTWEKYIGWYMDLMSESMRVLKPNGNIFTMNLPKQNSHLRTLCLDDIAHQVYEYVWIYRMSIGMRKGGFTPCHRTILHATKSKDNAFYKQAVAEPYQKPDDPRTLEYMERTGSKGRSPYSWMQMPYLTNMSPEKTIHPCQIPQDLSRKFINVSTVPGDSVFILFGGSGSEVVLCQEMKRQWVSCEMHPKYVEIIQHRLDEGFIHPDHRLKRK